MGGGETREMKERACAQLPPCVQMYAELASWARRWPPPAATQLTMQTLPTGQKPAKTAPLSALSHEPLGRERRVLCLPEPEPQASAPLVSELHPLVEGVPPGRAHGAV